MSKDKIADSIEEANLLRQKRILEGKQIKPVTMKEANAALCRSLNKNTQKAFEKIGLENYRLNSWKMKQSKGIKDLEINSMHRTPAFLVAAGPCLTKNADELRAIQGRYPILACDAAVKPLIQGHGVTPNFVFLVDVKGHQKDLWAGVDTSNICLVTHGGVHPDSLKAWDGPIRFFNTLGSTDMRDVQLKYGRQFGALMVGGNVSSVMLSLARAYLHADPVVFVGHDYSFPKPGSYYCHGAAHERAAWTKDYYTIHDIYGDEVYTDFSLWSYAIWTGDMIAGTKKQFKYHGLPPLTFINATEGGILGVTTRPKRNSKRLEYTTLKEAIARADEIYAATFEAVAEGERT